MFSTIIKRDGRTAAYDVEKIAKAIFQAATQIHEQTLTFVPKILVTALLMVVLGSWMLGQINDLIQSLFGLMAGL